MHTFLSLLLSLNLPISCPIHPSLTSGSNATFESALRLPPHLHSGFFSHSPQTIAPSFFWISLPSIPDSLILPLSFIISPFLPFPLPISFPSLSLSLYPISNFPIFQDHQLVFLCIYSQSSSSPISHLSDSYSFLIVSLISLFSFCFLPQISRFPFLFLPLTHFSIFNEHIEKPPMPL